MRYILKCYIGLLDHIVLIPSFIAIDPLLLCCSSSLVGSILLKPHLYKHVLVTYLWPIQA
jgi:hypothetical protein